MTDSCLGLCNFVYITSVIPPCPFFAELLLHFVTHYSRCQGTVESHIIAAILRKNFTIMVKMYYSDHSIVCCGGTVNQCLSANAKNRLFLYF